MKQTKGAKTKKLSPKKGSQRITAFFRSRGSQHIDLSAQSMNIFICVIGVSITLKENILNNRNEI